MRSLARTWLSSYLLLHFKPYTPTLNSQKDGSFAVQRLVGTASVGLLTLGLDRLTLERVRI